MKSWAALVDYVDYEYAYKKLFAGCGRWASAGSVAVSSSVKPRYWSVREVKFGEEWAGYETLHWVVELRNERTGEVFYLDGWTAAKKARPVGSATRPDNMKIAHALPTYADLYGKWGPISGQTACIGARNLCSPGTCEAKR